MPGRPKDRRRDGKVWAIEILFQSNAEQSGRANDDMRITCEVEEELKAEPDCQQPHVNPAPASRDLIEPCCHTFARVEARYEKLGQHYFHEKPYNYSACAFGHIVPRGSGGLAKLRQH